MTSLKWATEAQDAQIPSLAEQAANEDSPTGGALYRLIARRPSRIIPGIAVALSLIVVGGAGAYIWGLLGLEGLRSLPLRDVVLLAAATLFPVALIWLATYAIWRGREMHLMAEALARTAVRLTDPAAAATGEIGTIAQSVQRDINAMKKGLSETLEQATNLRTLILEELAAIENGSTAAEARAQTMEKLLGSYRENLTELGQKLSGESETITGGLREQADIVHGLIGKADETLQAASSRLAYGTETLVRVSETARDGADKTALTLSEQATRLEVVAAQSLSKADSLTTRYELQRQIISEAAGRLEAERTRLEDIFETHRSNLANADKILHERTDHILRTASDLAGKLNTTFDEAAGRADSLRETISTDISKAVSEVGEASGVISRSAGAATRAIGATVDELRSANAALTAELPAATTKMLAGLAEDVRKATGSISAEIMRVSASLGEDINARSEAFQKLAEQASSDSDLAAERFNAAMLRLGGVARDAGQALHSATDELESRIAQLPNEAASSANALTQVLQEQVSALAAIAEIVVRHARVLDRSAPPTREIPAASHSSSFQPAPPPLPEITRGLPQTVEAKRRWGISDLLAAAGRGERDETPSPNAQNATLDDNEFQRSSLQIIETLQALAIDLDRALEQTPPAELWQRYQAGERNVFTRRLYNIAGRQLYDRIAMKYRADAEFREHVERFVNLFERLLAAAAARDRSNILVETYLTSDTGKAYLILAQASGKLA